MGQIYRVIQLELGCLHEDLYVDIRIRIVARVLYALLLVYRIYRPIGRFVRDCIPSENKSTYACLILNCIPAIYISISFTGKLRQWIKRTLSSGNNIEHIFILDLSLLVQLTNSLPIF
jgi:hypothetical protein